MDLDKIANWFGLVRKEVVEVQNNEQPKEEEVRDFKEVYNEVRSILKEYIELSQEEEYDILVNWVFHTRLADDFGITPYIKLNGVPGSGKTTIMEVCQLLVNNGKVLSGMNEARIVRMLESSIQVIFLDEFEGMSRYTKTELESVLNQGYKKRSAHSVRCEGTSFEAKEKNIFSPKMIATVKDFKSITLNDRCIEIITVKAQKELKQTIRISEEEMQRFEVLKNAINNLMQEHKTKILENFDSFNEAFARHRELIGVICSIAKEVAEDKKLLDYYFSRVDEKESLSLEYDWQYNLLVALKDITDESRKKFFVKEITVKYREQLGIAGIKEGTTGRELHKLGLKSSKRQSEGIPYYLSSEDVDKAIKRNGYAQHFEEPSVESVQSEPEIQ
ncbi:ATP-binding protein [Candidatus Woesearchaeota archaeon]|nr:ATP-binding protein [Candidatus Woesearchaeota archaeon]